MRLDTINKLCCPFDKKDLSLQVFVQDTNSNVLQGILSCKHCRRIYPVVHGVPIMAPDEYREFRLEQPLLEQWNNKTFLSDSAPLSFPAPDVREEPGKYSD